jgi:hypothetical protein
MKQSILNEFKDGFKYRPPLGLLDTSGKDWAFQPLYVILATNVFQQYYRHYKDNKIDKTYIPHTSM